MKPIGEYGKPFYIVSGDYFEIVRYMHEKDLEYGLNCLEKNIEDFITITEKRLLTFMENIRKIKKLCPHLDNAGNCCKTVSHKKCNRP
jgi:hypothetical protein